MTTGGGGGDDCVDDGDDCDDYDGPDCCEGSCVDGTCGNYDPLVVDLSGAGFSLTNAQNGVKFDFFGTGNSRQMPWTAAGSSTGWLVLDRNGDGLIDRGAEMFSNVAPQADTNPRTRIGFRALAVYDQPVAGGNGDGVIDLRDAVFSKLLVWVDKNHDGISEPGELLTMQQAAIQSISLHYQLSNWIDAYGNGFRSRSQIVFTGGGPPGDRYIYDVSLGANAASKPQRRPKR